MNERGEVIGVATMMVMGGQNLNMAVPSATSRPCWPPAEPRPFSPAVLVASPRAGWRGSATAAAPIAGRERQDKREPMREVEDQLTIVRPMLQLRGSLPAFPFALGEAGQAEGAAHAFQLERGVSYLITARCDAGATTWT